MTSRHAGLRRCICRAEVNNAQPCCCAAAQPHVARPARRPLADRPCRPPPVPDRRHAARRRRRRRRRRHVLRNSAPGVASAAGRVGKTRHEADRSRRGEGGPLCRASVLLQGHGAAPGAVARSPAAGTPTSAPEDQIDQQHFSFRLRLCGRRAWLAWQWMLPRAVPESGTRGCISALPCLASPVSQYACSASLLRLGPQPRSARSAAGRLAGEGRVLAPQ